MLGSYRLPFVVGAATSLGGGAYVGLMLPSVAAVQQRMVQETQEGKQGAQEGKQGAQEGRQGGQEAKLAEAATSAPAAVASNASTAASSSSSNGVGGGGAVGGVAGFDGGAGEGSSSGLVVGALPRLLLLCFYLFCTCISQGFLLVAQ